MADLLSGPVSTTTGAPPAPPGRRRPPVPPAGAPGTGTGPSLPRPSSPLRSPPGQRRRSSTPPVWSERLVAWRYFDAAVLLALAALSLGLHWRTLWTNYWGDEAIAIGIAAHPLGSIPHYLVNDGSPPLYYVALHYWMEVFGRSEPATHALSLIPALLAVPAAWWCGERLSGRRAARIAAALVATCSYLDYYGTETRMYAWLVLAAMLAITCFVLAYRGAGPRYWVAAVALMTIVLYLQYYALYLLAATVVTGLALAAAERSRQKARSTALFGAICAAAFAPWAPQFVYQLEHTGAPWAPHPGVLDFFGDSFNALASAGWAGIVFAIAVAVLGRRRGGPSGTLLASLAIPLGALVLAWAAGQVVNSWNPRYLGIAVVPALVPLACALAQARWGRLAACAAFACLTATAVPMVVDRGVTVETAKSDAAYLIAELRPDLRPGALVISSEVTDTPVFALDLGPGYRYATPLGLLSDPLVVNWTNLSTRLQSLNPDGTLSSLIDSLPAGGQVLIINPTTWGGGETPEKYEGAVEAVAVAADVFVASDPALREVKQEGVPPYSEPLYPMEATLYVKVAAPLSK